MFGHQKAVFGTKLHPNSHISSSSLVPITEFHFFTYKITSLLLIRALGLDECFAIQQESLAVVKFRIELNIAGELSLPYFSHSFKILKSIFKYTMLSNFTDYHTQPSL